MMSGHSIRNFVVVLAAAAVLGLGGAGVASAEEQTESSATSQGGVGPVEPFDPQTELQNVVCVPDGSLLRPTALCEVPGPSGDEGDRVNPYTEDGGSPGLVGLGTGLL